jgi:U3 small nucleolar RNA-associated protein 5
MFSPAEGKIVGTLSGVHERGIKDFQFVIDDYSQGWSIGGDDKLAQWDLASNKAIRYVRKCLIQIKLTLLAE